MKEDLANFRQIISCILMSFSISLEKKMPLRNTQYICIKEMFATCLPIIGHNSRYSITRKTFGQAYSTSSRNFIKIVKSVNTTTPDMLVKPRSIVPNKIRKSTRVYYYFEVNYIIHNYDYY